MTETQRIVIRDHQIYVENYGKPDSKTIILLHHGLGSTSAWRALIPQLDIAGYRVIAYDRWGYGRSSPRRDFPMPGFEEDLMDLSTILSVHQLEKTVLVGHSDGGTISLLFAEQHPEAVLGLVTIAAHIYVEEKMVSGMEGILELFEHDTHFRNALERVHGDKFEQVFYTWYNGWYRNELRDWNISSNLRNISCPTLVIQGIDDEHATPQHARDLAEHIPGADLWLLPGAGHMLPQYNPEIFNQGVLDFLVKIC